MHLMTDQGTFLVGWASTDITPDQPALIAGQFHVRLSEGVLDPISATVLAMESRRDGRREQSLQVCCDLVCIVDELRDAIRSEVARLVPDIDPTRILFNATHTHCAPETRAGNLAGMGDAGVELKAMSAEQYTQFIVPRIAQAVADAWQSRQPAGMAYGLGQASVGFNRRICFENGETRMYGNVRKREFTHIEGGDDTSIPIAAFYDAQDRLTGVIINVACPSQADEHKFEISADYWCQVRDHLRRKLGEHLFILPQCSAAGDLVPARPTTLPDYPALERMWKLAGVTQRDAIAQAITDAVTGALKVIAAEIDRDPVLRHEVATVELTRRRLEQSDVDAAMAEAEKARLEYEKLKAELDANPALREKPRWYVPISQARRRSNWNSRVAERFAEQDAQPRLPFEIHVIRLGSIAIASNPFEYYRDFGHQIKANSAAMQTFVVQLAGPGGYLPTLRAASAGSYGALPASTPIGPEGGRELALWTIDCIAELFKEAT